MGTFAGVMVKLFLFKRHSCKTFIWLFAGVMALADTGGIDAAVSCEEAFAGGMAGLVVRKVNAIGFPKLTFVAVLAERWPCKTIRFARRKVWFQTTKGDVLQRKTSPFAICWE